MGGLFPEFTHGDIRFLVETVEPRLVDRLDTVKGDPAIIEGMLEQEVGKLFQRLIFVGEETILTSISPCFLFNILLRQAVSELETQTYTIEHKKGQRIPVFDTDEVVQFLGDRTVLNYLAQMLASFTKIESFTMPVRERKGVWRKYRYSDMDIDSLITLCEAVDEESRFAFYKRIADLCLFILGMFPEYVASDLDHSNSGERVRRPLRRLNRTAADYEEEGKRFYQLALEHRNSSVLELNGVFEQLQEKFNLAQKPLNYISEHFLQFRKQKIFPSLSSG